MALEQRPLRGVRGLRLRLRTSALPSAGEEGKHTVQGYGCCLLCCLFDKPAKLAVLFS